jgi:hypothetical protein
MTPPVPHRRDETDIAAVIASGALEHPASEVHERC